MSMSTNVEEFNAAVQKFSATLEKEQIKPFVTKIALEALTRVVLKTPVDTGRARGNWQVSIGSPRRGTLQLKDKAGTSTINKGTAKIVGAPMFPMICLTNNLEYIDTLEYGLFRPKNPDDSKQGRDRRAKSRSKRQQDRARTELGDAGATFVRDGFSIQAPHGMVDVTIGELRRMFP